MELRYKNKLNELKNALDNLKKSLSIDINKYPEEVKDSLKSGQIQKFEFCIELTWKTIRYFLYNEMGIDVNSPKSSIKEFFNVKKLTYSEYEILIQMIDDRNYISHIYKEEMMIQLLVKLPDYLHNMLIVYGNLANALNE